MYVVVMRKFTFPGVIKFNDLEKIGALNLVKDKCSFSALSLRFKLQFQNVQLCHILCCVRFFLPADTKVYFNAFQFWIQSLTTLHLVAILSNVLLSLIPPSPIKEK